MKRILVIWVGKRPDAAWESLAADYRERAARYVDLAEVRVRPAEGRLDARRALAQEAAAIRSHLVPGDHLVALDERGREVDTPSFASLLTLTPASTRLAFVLGSDLGLDAALKAEAHERVALSRLTFAHALARVVLLEQIYRALDLTAGGRYHRA